MPETDEHKGDPWFKFYAGDWRGDEKLRVCSLAARGLWIECMALMHKADPYGYLLVNGAPPTPQELGKLTAATTGEVGRCIDELVSKGVCSVTDGGVIFSRRMVRDKAKRDKASADGKRGGNPALVNTYKPTLKGEVNGVDIHARDGRARSDSRSQTVQEHKEQRAKSRRREQETLKTPEDAFRHLVAMTIAELETNEFEGDGDCREHMKFKAAQLGFPYDSATIGRALDKAQRIRATRSTRHVRAS